MSLDDLINSAYAPMTAFVKENDERVVEWVKKYVRYEIGEMEKKMKVVPINHDKTLEDGRDEVVRWIGEKINQADGWVLIIKSHQNIDSHPEFHHCKPGDEYQMIGLLETVKQLMMRDLLDENQ